jgi:hypothetical protein
MLGITACGPLGWGRRRAAGPGLGALDRSQPALSGDGRLLASISLQGGRDTVLLQEQATGRSLPLRHLRQHQPHSSPALSWTGRYLALLVQQGPRRLAVIEDRLTGRWIPLPLPGDQEPLALSLAPDGRHLAVELLRQGQRRVQVFALADLLEADLPGGLAVQGGGPPAGETP